MDSEAPPPPKITSEAVVTTDITEQFVAAAKSTIRPPSLFPASRHRDHWIDKRTALEPGELVKDGFFTLFEAVGGLEVRLHHFCQGAVPDAVSERC